MAKRTRTFLLASAGVLAAVLATALVARAGAALGSNTPDELAYVPGTAQGVVYANVRQVMNSPFRERFRRFDAANGATPDGVEARTGIQFDKDVDSLLVASMGDDIAAVVTPPAGAGAISKSPSLVIARGRFDVVRIEALMREQGAQVEQYRGKRVVSIKDDAHDAALTFAESGLLVFGVRDGVHGALDAKAGAAQGITSNDEFMALVDGVDEGTAWSVARFDSVSGRAPLPGAVISQLPPINWLAASGRIDSGLHGLVRAEARDEQSAQNLRDVVQGFLSLARMQGSRDPAYKGMLDSVALNAQGKSVSLTFDVTPGVLDMLTSQQGGPVRGR